MEPLTRIAGTAVPLDRADVDTDQIIPARHLKRIERTGFGPFLFEEWRADPDFVLNDGGTLIYCSPSPGVNTAVGDFPGLALMDLMKPYMPATPENYQRVLKDIHARKIQMWAGCIWVPIYEVMMRKHLTMVTLEENLAMAAEIGIDATTSLDEAYAQALARQGADAKVIVLPFARYQLPRNAIRMSSEPLHVPAGAHA